MNSLFRFIRPGIFAFVAAAVFACLTLVYDILGLPDPATVATYAKSLYENFGTPVLFFAAFVEAIFAINLYLPGSLVIVLSVYLSDGSLSSLAVIALVVWAGFSIAIPLNYILGATGLYRIVEHLAGKNSISKMDAWLNRRGGFGFFAAAFHPNFQAIAVVCLGIVRRPFMRTLLTQSSYVAVWVPIWTLIFSVLRKSIDVTDSSQPWYIVILLVSIGVILIGVEQFKRQSRASAP